jgi:hypothetical protein
MTDEQYLAIQVCIVCVLLFAVSVTAVTQHPSWFG